MVSTACILGALSIFSIFFGESSQSETTAIGCHTDVSLISSIKVAAAWEALFLYDSMLFVMTLRVAYQTRNELQEFRIPLLVVILRDGSLYFGVMAFANAINISTFYYPLPYIRGALSTFASGIAVAMMSRLMLNLHKIADTGLYTSHVTTIQLGADSAFITARPANLRDMRSEDAEYEF
ncbi:hypothetical protein GYMLUDRAFT_43779 [Collybiopsis luxurians FD-317 M1]|uniref:Uncharacterized protein n=1 Tax=Collybiopsis luxurians FD-317 M1 TaxID=944289 RepID=A0A0D0CWI2_9AGAR|nr:hypothetical protein GYMLUDRAFT_43779 [Collybiopsis luxurians FD-317 M1]